MYDVYIIYNFSNALKELCRIQDATESRRLVQADAKGYRQSHSRAEFRKTKVSMVLRLPRYHGYGLVGV